MRWAVLFSLVAFTALADEDGAFELAVPNRLKAPPMNSVSSLPPEKDLLAGATVGPDGAWYSKGQRLTIDGALQKQLVEIMKTYQTPYAAVVAIEPSTGRVLAMAEHSEADPSLRGLCTKALYPAASIFKIVTAAALLQAGVKAEDTACYHGGKRKVSDRLLEDSELDTRCVTLAEAMGLSANVVFAKLTAKFLDAERLKLVTRAFHFNAPIAFPVPTDPSLAAIPDETVPLAATGAGFGDVFLSPLHGAALAATTANKGEWRTPVLFEKDVPAAQGEQVIDAAIATQLSDMMETTVTTGTARRIFHERGMGVPEAVGKTGSLADKEPFRDYSWFVGFAPKSAPRVAVAAVIVNDPYWRIRATWLGREAMRLFLTKPKQVAGLPAPAASSGSSASP